MWQVKHNTWQVTHDRLQVLGDIRDMTHGVGWIFSQNSSSLAHTVCDLWCCEYLEEKDRLLNEWMNYEAVCRTAPATTGLLNIKFFIGWPELVIQITIKILYVLASLGLMIVTHSLTDQMEIDCPMPPQVSTLRLRHQPVTQNRMALKIECLPKWNITQNGMSTKNEISLKI